MSMLEAKSQVHQFFAPRYPVDLEESLAAVQEEVASIDVPASDLAGKASWDLSVLMGRPDLDQEGRIRGDYECFREAFSVVCKSIPLSVSDL